jgi:hypothetical protein
VPGIVAGVVPALPGTFGVTCLLLVAFGVACALDRGVIVEIGVLPVVLVGVAAKDEEFAHEISQNEQNSRIVAILLMRLTSIEYPLQITPRFDMVNAE